MPRRTALVLAAAITLAASGAGAQSMSPTLSDPMKCVLVLDEMGDVGFRISDSQAVADSVITGMRKRIGFDGVAYAGIAQSASAMKKLLATPEGAGPQDQQLQYFKKCEENATWRMRARVGTDKAGTNKHWVTLACRKKGADPDPKKGALVEEKRFTGKTFLEARDALAAAVPTFCTQIPSVTDIPIETGPVLGAQPLPPGLAPKKELKPWTPPPRRE